VKRSARRRGTVLIVALFVLVAVTFVALTLAREARVELQVAARAKDEVIARALVDSAVDRALAALKADDTPEDTLRDLWRDDETNLRGQELGAGKYWIFFGEPDPGDGRERKYGMRDEASKLNVNTATREQLLMLPGMTADIADSIIDWRDADDDQGEQGAEAPYYNALSPGYAPKNGPIESLEELLRVKGIDESILWGEDRNRNGILDPGEDDGDKSFPPDDANGALTRGLADYLTVYAFDENKTLDGKTRLNITSAVPTDVMDRLTTAGMSGQLVQRTFQFIAQRRGQIQSVGDLVDVPGMDEPGFQICADQLTTTDTTRIPGRVNVNTASREILAGLPTLTEDDVEAIISRRTGTGEDLSSVAWLLRVLPKQKVRAVFEAVTTRSWQFTIQVAVCLTDRPEVSRRVEVVVDRAYAPIRILWRRDLTALGFPLPNERGEKHP
jgi:DNA uptake protein ComE-like DNA-binding protein